MAYIGVSPSNGVRRKHTYTATAAQTSFTGAGAEGITLSYLDSNYVDVYQNGVKLSEADYTSTTGTTVVLATGAFVSDMVEIVVYDVFSVADTVSKSAGGTFDADVTFADGADIITASAGTSNTRIGVNTGNTIASGGNFNVLIGDEAGTAITTGDGNTAVGFEALKTEDANGTNTAVGYRALKTLNGGADTNNTAVGNNAGAGITTGVQNTIIGALAGDSLGDADMNVAVGYNALTADTLGSRSTAIGRGALAVQNFTSATDSNNTAVGFGAGVAVSTGVDNTLLGATAGASLNTGNQNVIIGSSAGDAMSDADRNVAIGFAAMGVNTKSDRNVAIGRSALENHNITSVTQGLNTAIGNGAGSLLTTGTANTLIGGFSGNDDFDMRTGSNHVVLSDGAGSVVARHNSTTWRFSANDFGSALEFDGAQFYPLEDNAIKNGHPSNRWTVVYATTTTISSSDQELKQNIESLSEAELRVATRIKGLIKKYRWKDAVAIKGDNARIHVGAIAQEVKQAFTDESLDADRYAIFCKDEWYEVDGKPAESLLEPYTSETQDAVKVTRLGLRYEQLLAFVLATL